MSTHTPQSELYTRNMHVQWASRQVFASPTWPAQLCTHMSINNIPDRDRQVYTYIMRKIPIQSLALMHSANIHTFICWCIVLEFYSGSRKIASEHWLYSSCIYTHAQHIIVCMHVIKVAMMNHIQCMLTQQLILHINQYVYERESLGMRLRLL